MKYFFGGLLFLLAIQVQGQALRDINYNYLYDPNQQVILSLKLVKGQENFTCLYNLQWRDTTNEFTIRWEIRPGLGDREGSIVNTGVTDKEGPGKSIGKVTIPIPKDPQVLVAKVINDTEKKAWMFYKIIEPTYPSNAFLINGGEEVLQNFITTQQPVSYQGPGSSITATYYNDNFPSAAPAFAEAQARVPKKMAPDSIFSFSAGETIRFAKTGLYLLQQDTSATDALAFRAEDDYPRLARVESLADPLIYVCTKQEFDKVKAAKGDKKAFDRVILGITGDTERARNFMRSYFRRVELANQFFTSYKEGWKTDRGMIYIIFGLPDEVFKFSDREVWSYKNTTFKVTFNFAKSGTIFDPDNFVLIRAKKYQETWYEVIDLWRNARF